MDEKISGTYDWIKDRNNMVLFDNSSSYTLQAQIKSIQETAGKNINAESLFEYGSKMAKFIFEIIDDWWGKNEGNKNPRVVPILNWKKKYVGI